MKLVQLLVLAVCLVAWKTAEARPTRSPDGTRARQFSSVESYLSRMVKDRQADQPSTEGNEDASKNRSKGRSFNFVGPQGFNYASSRYEQPLDNPSGVSRTSSYSNGYQEDSSYSSSYQKSSGDNNRFKFIPVPYEVYTLLDPEVRIIKTSRVNSAKPFTPLRTVITFESAEREYTPVGRKVYAPELIIQEESVLKKAGKSRKEIIAASKLPKIADEAPSAGAVSDDIDPTPSNPTPDVAKADAVVASPDQDVPESPEKAVEQESSTDDGPDVEKVIVADDEDTESNLSPSNNAGASTDDGGLIKQVADKVLEKTNIESEVVSDESPVQVDTGASSPSVGDELDVAVAKENKSTVDQVEPEAGAGQVEQSETKES